MGPLRGSEASTLRCNALHTHTHFLNPRRHSLRSLFLSFLSIVEHAIQWSISLRDTFAVEGLVIFLVIFIFTAPGDVLAVPSLTNRLTVVHSCAILKVAGLLIVLVDVRRSILPWL